MIKFMQLFLSLLTFVFTTQVASAQTSAPTCSNQTLLASIEQYVMLIQKTENLSSEHAIYTHALASMLFDQPAQIYSGCLIYLLETYYEKPETRKAISLLLDETSTIYQEWELAQNLEKPSIKDAAVDGAVYALYAFMAYEMIRTGKVLGIFSKLKSVAVADAEMIGSAASKTMPMITTGSRAYRAGVTARLFAQKLPRLLAISGAGALINTTIQYRQDVIDYFKSISKRKINPALTLDALRKMILFELQLEARQLLNQSKQFKVEPGCDWADAKNLEEHLILFMNASENLDKQLTQLKDETKKMEADTAFPILDQEDGYLLQKIDMPKEETFEVCYQSVKLDLGKAYIHLLKVADKNDEYLGAISLMANISFALGLEAVFEIMNNISYDPKEKTDPNHEETRVQLPRFKEPETIVPENSPEYIPEYIYEEK